MAINTKYSHNGYNPKEESIVAKKTELKKKFEDGARMGKSLIKASRPWLNELKNKLLIGTITKAEFTIALKTKRSDLKQQVLDAGLFTRSEYSKAITRLKRRYKKRNLRSVPVAEFNDSEIVGTSFFQNEPFTRCLPMGATGVVFIDCNLDNVVILHGYTVGSGCTNRHFLEQNDREDWVVNKDMEPIEPLHTEEFIDLGLSVDPKDIPTEKMERSITDIARHG